MKRLHTLAASFIALGAVLGADAPTTRPLAEFAKPTLVTLKLEKASLKDAIAALEKASKHKITSQPPDLINRVDEEGITLDFKDRPWLEAVLEICQQSNLTVSNYSDNWTLTASGDRRLRGRRWISGPVLISCNSAVLESDIRYGEANRTSRTLTLTGLIAMEPRVPIVNVSEVMDVIAIDERGRELKGVSIPSQSYNGAERRDFRFAIEVPDEMPAKLEVVRGMLIGSSLSKSVDLKIPDVLNAKGKSIKLHDAEFTVRSVTSTGPNPTVEIEVVGGKFPKDMFQRLASGQLQLNARIGEERRVGEVGLNQFRVEAGNPVVTLFIRQLGRKPVEGETPNLTLTWSLPVEFQNVSIPFEFKNIQLPK